MINKPMGNKRRMLLLLIVVMVQVLFLSGIAGSYYAVGWFGTEIKIKTIPVDPRDFLYGDYVTLSYEISVLKPSLWKESGDKPDEGERVYVALKPAANGIYEAVGVYRSKPAVSPDQAVLQAIVAYSWEESIHVLYGMERYYVPEGTGKELENQASNMIVRVKIASWGQARISGLEAMK
ncbi:GDYXXLXY domain-containing protein [Paenibacillus agricola]|uniref:GDYXXLXY domain-containing protein n=1 Tax=Paenibacillus agricola TaxID=2716264 RepID=A0ABX0J3N5_9BACL|nr:GDYXXLXY domain-containing protein [Paenibacillus agricola]NHN30025.1 GDYXXLXY domain-containing protein [Paenibacillus agricola]